MNTFKKKSLYAALAGVSALGVTGAAQAVNVNPDGLGQVLIYPYYTVRDKVPGAPFGSLLSVVNSTASAKAVKVRFNEGKNSREVLDFNLFLSKKDVWTVAVLGTADGAGIATADKSCTVPTVSNNAAAPSAFVNYAYLSDPIADASLDRTREGYVEIIEMGTITKGSDTEVGVTHKNGVPPCTALADSTVSSSIEAPTGGLFGGLTLINVLAGEDYTEDAVALDQFRLTGKYDAPGSIKPDLRDVNPPTSVVFNGNAVFQSTNWFGGNVDAISALFMHDHIYNEFVLDAVTKSGTDWVITMPTKRYYYTDKTLKDGTVIGQVDFLFQRNMNVNGGCDDVSATLYDREESTTTPSVSFSPPRPGKANTLCWEANVVTFNGSNVLGSKNSRNIATTYSNGWADLLFPTPTSTGPTGGPIHYLPSGTTTITPLTGVSSVTNVSYFGLPVIGFAVQSFNNGTLNVNGSLVQSQYGGNFVHKFTRVIK
jgi:hypothetical protein